MDTIQEEPDIPINELRQDTTEPMAPSIPVMVPEMVAYNNATTTDSTKDNHDDERGIPNSNDLIEFTSTPEKNSISDQQPFPSLNKTSSISNEIKSNSKSFTTNNTIDSSPGSPGSPGSPDSLDKTKSSGSKKEESSLNDDIQNRNNNNNNNNTITDNDETLGSGSGNGNNRSYNDLIKSQESLKLKLIDVVLPEDLTSSQSNFIFEYEESLRSSQPNFSDIQQLQSMSMDSSNQATCQNSVQTGLNSTQNSTQLIDRSNSDSLEKQMFKKKYKQHGPSKLGGEPLNIGEDEDEDEDDDENQNQNKFSHLAMGSMELLHEKLKH
jgi:hypothetical protein